VGLLTGSLGILAEALHSGLDLVAALVTFFAVRLADRPPDDTHTFGYGKVENLSALIETILLLITCVWIIYEAIQRLVFRTVEIEASIWAFAVIILSIFVDVNRSRLLHRVAKKHHSQALEADALHFSTDVWSSSVVLLGLALVWLSDRLGPGWEFLVKADAVAALGVAVIVIWVSLQLGRRTVNVLLDATPPGLTARQQSLRRGEHDRAHPAHDTRDLVDPDVDAQPWAADPLESADDWVPLRSIAQGQPQRALLVVVDHLIFLEVSFGLQDPCDLEFDP